MISLLLVLNYSTNCYVSSTTQKGLIKRSTNDAVKRCSRRFRKVCRPGIFTFSRFGHGAETLLIKKHCAGLIAVEHILILHSKEVIGFVCLLAGTSTVHRIL